jgi:hypothetical protein
LLARVMDSMRAVHALAHLACVPVGTSTAQGASLLVGVMDSMRAVHWHALTRWACVPQVRTALGACLLVKVTDPMRTAHAHARLACVPQAQHKVLACWRESWTLCARRMHTLAWHVCRKHAQLEGACLLARVMDSMCAAHALARLACVPQACTRRLLACESHGLNAHDACTRSLGMCAASTVQGACLLARSHGINARSACTRSLGMCAASTAQGAGLLARVMDSMCAAHALARLACVPQAQRKVLACL